MWKAEKLKTINLTSAKGLYAFWRHDLFPYYLGGTITRMDEKGRVETVQFGMSHWFKPVVILPEAAGEQLNSQLKQLKAEKEKEEKELHDKWIKEVRIAVRDLFPDTTHLDNL